MNGNFFPIGVYVKQKPVLIFSVLSVLLNIFMWVWLWYQIGPRPDAIFLHYNILFGVDLLGVWTQIFSVPLAGAAILIINFFLGWILHGQDKLASYLLNFSHFFCQLLLVVVSLILVFLNV